MKSRVSTCLRFLFFLLIVRPIMLIVLGFNIRGYEKLPKQGPLVVVANHNSHLDALALITLFGLKRLPEVQPVGAADYFLRNPVLKWFSLSIIGIIPFDRSLKNIRDRTKPDLFASITTALQEDKIVILFPEGSRGEPEKLERFKTGIARVAARHPEVPMSPIFLYGLGKSLPRGEALLVPFVCDIFVGDPLFWSGDRVSFMNQLNEAMQGLSSQGNVQSWD